VNTAFIQITDRCNLKCLHCIWDKTKSPEKAVLNRAALKSIWPVLKAEGFEDINLTGGEPFLNRELFGILEDVSELGFHKSVCTNGLFLTDAAIARIAQIGIDFLSISLNSLGEEENAITRPGGNGVYEKIAKCHRAGLPGLHLGVTLTRKTISEVNALVDFAEDINAKISFQPLYIPKADPKYFDYSLSALTPIELGQIIPGIRDSLTRSDNQSFLMLLEDWYAKKKRTAPKECFARNSISRNIIIDHDGTVYPCFFRKDLGAGNIFKEQASEIFSRLSERQQKLTGIPCFGEHCAGLHM
jgi:MoaA/NifB/PqqE/SkfB family radical SAM enzyme